MDAKFLLPLPEISEEMAGLKPPFSQRKMWWCRWSFHYDFEACLVPLFKFKFKFKFKCEYMHTNTIRFQCVLCASLYGAGFTCGIVEKIRRKSEIRHSYSEL